VIGKIIQGFNFGFTLQGNQAGKTTSCHWTIVNATTNFNGNAEIKTDCCFVLIRFTQKIKKRKMSKMR
jgi:hypothetical protein